MDKNLKEQLEKGIENVRLRLTPSFFEFKYGRKPDEKEQELLNMYKNAYNGLIGNVDMLRNNPMSPFHGKDSFCYEAHEGLFIYIKDNKDIKKALELYKDYLKDLVEEKQQEVRELTYEEYF